MASSVVGPEVSADSSVRLGVEVPRRLSSGRSAGVIAAAPKGCNAARDGPLRPVQVSVRVNAWASLTCGVWHADPSNTFEVAPGSSRTGRGDKPGLVELRDGAPEPVWRKYLEDLSERLLAGLRLVQAPVTAKNHRMDCSI